MATIDAYLNRMEQLLTRGWCRGHSAIDRFKTACHPCEPQATSWCFQGARIRAARDLEPANRKTEYNNFGHFLNRVLDNDGVHSPSSHVFWNDKPGQTQEGVLSYVRYLRAIAQVGGL